MKFSTIYEAQTVETTREAEYELFHQIMEPQVLFDQLAIADLTAGYCRGIDRCNLEMLRSVSAAHSREG